LNSQKEGSKQITSQTKEIHKQRKELLNDYPVLELRSCFRGSRTELVEVVLTEKFLQLFGYSVDSLASIVLIEGLPQYFL